MKVRNFFAFYTVLLALLLYFGIWSIGAHHPALTVLDFTLFGFNLHSVVNGIITLRSRSWLMRP